MGGWVGFREWVGAAGPPPPSAMAEGRAGKIFEGFRPVFAEFWVGGLVVG